MTYIDISSPLSANTPVYPGDPALEQRPLGTLEADGFSTTWLGMHTHLGTHVDPPRHLFEDGATADQLPLEILCGPARVVELRGRGLRLGAEALRDLPLAGVQRLLLKTDKGPRGEEAALTVDAAHLLLAGGALRLLGIDALSVEGGDDPTLPVHRLLLGASPWVVLLEGLRLDDVAPGDYELLCLPLRLLNGDGAPARAALRRLASSWEP